MGVAQLNCKRTNIEKNMRNGGMLYVVQFFFMKMQSIFMRKACPGLLSSGQDNSIQNLHTCNSHKMAQQYIQLAFSALLPHPSKGMGVSLGVSHL